MSKYTSSNFLHSCIICLQLIAPLQVIASSSSLVSNAQSITLGIIPQFKKHRMQSIWKPVVRELALATGLKIKLIIPNSIAEFESRLLAGEFDFSYMNPYQILLANKSAGYQPIAFDKQHKLQGIIVVKKNGNIDHISQLNGKDMAFPSLNALGASLLIRAELKDLHHINVNNRFLRSHDNVYLNIVQGHLLAGGGVLKTLNNQPLILLNKLKIIYKTQAVSAHPFAVHPRIQKKIQNIFYKALYAMSTKTDGLKKLERIPLSSISPATYNDYKPLEDLQLQRFH